MNMAKDKDPGKRKSTMPSQNPPKNQGRRISPSTTEAGNTNLNQNSAGEAGQAAAKGGGAGAGVDGVKRANQGVTPLQKKMILTL